MLLVGKHRSISQGTVVMLLQLWAIQNMVACEKIVTSAGGKLNTFAKIKNEVQNLLYFTIVCQSLYNVSLLHNDRNKL